MFNIGVKKFHKIQLHFYLKREKKPIVVKVPLRIIIHLTQLNQGFTYSMLVQSSKIQTINSSLTSSNTGNK